METDSELLSRIENMILEEWATLNHDYDDDDWEAGVKSTLNKVLDILDLDIEAPAPQYQLVGRK